MGEKSKERWFWLDMEMSGLKLHDVILEIAIFVSDTELNVLSQGPNLIINQPAEIFPKMDAWNQKHHTASGLWQEVQKSNTSVQQAEDQVLEFIKQHSPAGEGILAGNSIWQDRRFLHRYMPKVDSYLHYRMLDVTSLKIIQSAWKPKIKFKKGEHHRALDDAKESLAELAHYRKVGFVS